MQCSVDRSNEKRLSRREEGRRESGVAAINEVMDNGLERKSIAIARGDVKQRLTCNDLPTFCDSSI